MTDRVTELGNDITQVAAIKANKDLGNESGLLSSKTGGIILDKYIESEVNRENSFRDPMTGLLNRTGLVEEYILATRTRERVGSEQEKNVLLALDLIGLKKFNQELSPEIADGIIKNVAKSLRKQVRETDLVGRWGGDEFLLVLFGAGESTAHSTIEKVIKNSPEGVHYSIGFQVIEKGIDPEKAFVGIMNKLEEVKKLGLTDKTGRSIGGGVVVNIDTLNNV